MLAALMAMVDALWSSAVVVGGIRIGNGVKIGAGAVVHTDIPDGSTVVSQPSRILTRSTPWR